MVIMYNANNGVLSIDSNELSLEELRNFREEIEKSPKKSIDLCIRVGPLESEVIFGVKRIELYSLDKIEY